MTGTMTAEVPTTRIDIMSDAVANDPWPALGALRALGPVVWHDTYRRWMVSTDREVRKIVVDFRRFTVEGTSMVDLFGKEAFISTDDRRRHDDLRGVWNDAFRKQSLDALRPTVARIVAGLVAPIAERVRSGEAADVTADLCRPLPTTVIALMMGVPDDMLADIVRWTDMMGASGTAYLIEDPAEADRVRRAGAEAKAAMADYLIAQLADRRARPADDLISTLANAEVARGLPDDHLVQNVRQLLFAGNETTAKWLAQIVLAYGEHPDVRRELVSGRALIPAANDEVMRWQGVTGTLVRRVRGGPAEIGGVEMAEGDLVTCILSAANRDPARYDDPDRFDIHRPPQANLGFGVGFHNCLGLALAKLEADVAVNGLLDAVPDYAIAAPYRFSALPLRGPMPVRIALDRRGG
jgi:cytochrome P450